MTDLFEEGGEHSVESVGGDEYRFHISLPTDADGMLGRFCIESTCSPGYFKVKPGTGIVGSQEVAYCPYCKDSGDPKDFATPAQIEFGKDIVINEAAKGVNEMIKDAFGLGPTSNKKIGDGLVSMEISLKTENPKSVSRPIEEELRRDLICPSCGLEHSVYGLAFWCPDCGQDLFLRHVEAELEVVRKIILAAPSRKEALGVRIAAKDLDNSLEDIVSIFETVLKIIVRLLLEKENITEDSWQEVLQKKIRNKFQSISNAGVTIKALVNLDLYANLPTNELDKLNAIFEKRHPITHNLGIIDQKYMERIESGELGKEVRVTEEELLASLEIVMKIMSDLYDQTLLLNS